CSMFADPSGPPPTLLVRNGTCNPGPCASLTIRGNSPAVPSDYPGGDGIHLGSVGSASACLAFPASWSVTLGPFGGPKTTYTWTPADRTLLWAVDLGQFLGMTGSFRPADAPGWSVTFPTTNQSPPVAMATACTP